MIAWNGIVALYEPAGKATLLVIPLPNGYPISSSFQPGEPDRGGVYWQRGQQPVNSPQVRVPIRGWPSNKTSGHNGSGSMTSG